MNQIIVIEKESKIKQYLLESFQKLYPNTSVTFLESLKEIDTIQFDEQAVFFVNETYGIDFQLDTRYLVFHKFDEKENNCTFTLYIRRPLSKLQEVYDEIHLHKDVTDRLVLSDSKDFNIIPLKDVLYIERIKRYSLIKTRDRVYMTKESFSDLLPKLPSNFAQTHRSFIVNFFSVREFTRTDFVLESNDFVPISRSYRKDVEEKWNRFFQIYIKNSL
ncbi:MAG: LytTR family DNA-binding domain-containing protein [Bacillota bacterium]|nr:LytTR family DNA-binding domain-containing protein [Bacillota bacterium]